MAYIYLIGRLGGDPEVSYSSKGTKITKFGVAENVYRGGGQEDQTIWYNVVLFGDVSAQIIPFLKKGSLVQISGQYSPREWEEKTTGQKRVSQEIVAHHLAFVPGGNARNEAGGSPPAMQGQQSYPQQPRSNQTHSNQPHHAGQGGSSGFTKQQPPAQAAHPQMGSTMGHGLDEEEDEELPF